VTDEIRNDIVATRAELAETADALAAKVAEKSRVAKRVVLGVAGVAMLAAIVSRLRGRS
jgi:Protein of unknown function (DUF3618)